MTWVSFWSPDTVVVKDWHGWRTLSWPDRRELSSGTGAFHPRPGSDDFAVIADGRLTVNGEHVQVDGRVAELAWTPDGTLLVVTGRPTAPHRAPPSLLPVPAQGCTAQRFGSYPNEGMQLWRVPLGGGAPESLWRASGIQKVGKPTALPDGRVAFSLWDPPLYGAPASFRLRVLGGPGPAVDPFPELPGALHWTTTSPRGDAFSFWHSPLDPPFP